MKRAVLAILILSLCLGLCACGQPQVIEKEVEKIVEVVPEKYQDLFNALEAEDYNGAHAIITAMEPEPETPPIKEVKITTANFFDYFEYVEYPEPGLYIEKDSAGNVKTISCSPGYMLKREYTLAKESLRECSIEAGVRFKVYYFVYDENKNHITVDLSNRSYVITGKPDFINSEDTMIESHLYYANTPNPVFIIDFTHGNQLSNDGSVIIKDIELISASGTLYLYE